MKGDERGYAMSNDNEISLENRVFEESKTELELIIREGARRLLQEALEVEVLDYIGRFKQLKNSGGHRQVVRNGYLP